jgi:hypothetical protein
VVVENWFILHFGLLHLTTFLAPSVAASEDIGASGEMGCPSECNIAKSTFADIMDLLEKLFA